MYQGLMPVRNVNDLVDRILSIGDVVIFVLVSVALIFIVYNIVWYFIRGSSADESRKTAGMNILWGIVGLAIIVSIWGLVNIIVSTFKTDSTVPTFPTANFVNRQ